MQFLPGLLCGDSHLLEDSAGCVLQLTEVGGKTGRGNEIKLQEKSFIGPDLKRSLVDNYLIPPASIRGLQQERPAINFSNSSGWVIPRLGNCDGILIVDNQQKRRECRHGNDGLKPTQPAATRRNGIYRKLARLFLPQHFARG